MGQDPERLRADIAQTRAELDQDLDVLAEKVTPARVVERRVQATKGAVVSARDKVMGSSGAAVSDRSSGLASAAQDAPAQARRKAAGNPVAAGVVAFGLGWLVSSLVPASRAEQQGAGKVKDAARQVAEPAKQSLAQAASEMRENLEPAAQQAADVVKQEASDATDTVKGRADRHRTRVTQQAGSSASTVAGTAKDTTKKAKKRAQPSASDSDEQPTRVRRTAPARKTAASSQTTGTAARKRTARTTVAPVAQPRPRNAVRGRG